ncbi:hypothetical protein CMI41_04755 [Candidatus Pacearchaeota archaeon]|nr:hypothetical protein [Candidatus Pacearchaeota archaeon]
MLTAVITGVAGQDGSYLSELLLSKGYLVVGITRRHGVNEKYKKDRQYNDLWYRATKNRNKNFGICFANIRI